MWGLLLMLTMLLFTAGSAHAFCSASRRVLVTPDPFSGAATGLKYSLDSTCLEVGISMTFHCNHLGKTCTFPHEKCHQGRELGQFLSTFMVLKGKKLPMTFKILLKVLFVRKVDFAALLPAQCVSIWRAEEETQKSSFLTDRTFKSTLQNITLSMFIFGSLQFLKGLFSV